MSLGFQEIKIEDAPAGKIITLVIAGKLEKVDYEKFIPELEKFIEQENKIRLVVELRDFQGFSAGAMWEDTKFGLKHFNDFEKLAVIGNKAWEKAMTAFAKPFTMAKVRYFDESERDEAMEWIKKNGDED